MWSGYAGLITWPLTIYGSSTHSHTLWVMKDQNLKKKKKKSGRKSNHVLYINHIKEMWINCQLFQKKFGLLARYRRPKLNKCVLQPSSNQLDMCTIGGYSIREALTVLWSFQRFNVSLWKCEKEVCVFPKRGPSSSLRTDAAGKKL